MSKHHKWKRIGHYYHHKFQCVKCGCIKNTKTIGMIVYTTKDNKKYLYKTPECNEVNYEI